LAAMTMAGVVVKSAQQIPAGPFSPNGARGESAGGRGSSTPGFCRVVLVAAPSADSQINIEVWMPATSSWNGKLLGTDNGGFSGTIGYAAMASALTRGY